MELKKFVAIYLGWYRTGSGDDVHIVKRSADTKTFFDACGIAYTKKGEVKLDDLGKNKVYATQSLAFWNMNLTTRIEATWWERSFRLKQYESFDAFNRGCEEIARRAKGEEAKFDIIPKTHEGWTALLLEGTGLNAGNLKEVCTFLSDDIIGPAYEDDYGAATYTNFLPTFFEHANALVEELGKDEKYDDWTSLEFLNGLATLKSLYTGYRQDMQMEIKRNHPAFGRRVYWKQVSRKRAPKWQRSLTPMTRSL